MTKIKNKVIGIVVGRMDSTRFPGKMVQPLCDQPLITFIINRVKQISSLDYLAVATTDRPIDNIIAEYSEKCGVDVFRGSTQDVALRFLNCASKYQCDYFVRFNGDSPCIDIELVKSGIDLCAKGYDIITNIPSRTFAYGISLEIIKTRTFSRVYPFMNESDREHVTSYFYRNKTNFSIHEILNNHSHSTNFSFTIDIPQDLDRLNQFLKNDPNRSWRDVA
jgi:spore coat polysaccharide biosynthesis protein SpsF